MEATNIFPISIASVSNGLNLPSSTISDSINISSQYWVSLASFNAISSLLRKSLSDWALCASRTFAPTDVPERSSCFPSVLVTPGEASRKPQALTIRIANCLVLSVIGILLAIVNTEYSCINSNKITNYELRITNYL